ncbi:MAG: hypothetical protein N4A45_10325 [Flavobacteriales bacterium]|jgi:hypothetical protein|nr:hypothetical protein [Flavobacteriales bacterium]
MVKTSKYNFLKQLEDDGTLQLAVNCGVISMNLYNQYLAYKRYMEILPRCKTKTEAHSEIAVEHGYASANSVKIMLHKFSKE